MTDALRSRIIAHTDQPDIYDPPTREAMYARILRDAETIKAAEALADVLQAADNAVAWESLGFGNTFSDRVEKTLAAFRAAQEKNDD